MDTLRSRTACYCYRVLYEQFLFIHLFLKWRVVKERNAVNTFPFYRIENININGNAFIINLISC